MKKLFITILLLLATTSYASQKSITDKGEEAILKDDGTWVYSGDAQKATNINVTNKKKFERPKDSSFLLKSTRNNSVYWINTDKWSFEKAQKNPAAEYEFQLKGKDVYGMAINEGIEVSLDSLVDFALSVIRNGDPDAKIIKKEYRVVNGKTLIYMETNFTLKSIKFTYLGYYYSNTSGNTQLITYTATNLVDKYRSEINDFLNGFASSSVAFVNNAHAENKVEILIKAAWNNNIVLVEKLLAENVNINAKNKYGTTALMAAAQNGNDKLLKLLIKNGADVNVKNNHGRSALMLADYASTETIKVLLENRADVDSRNKYGATTLMLVAGCYDNYFEVVKLLIKYGANINAKDNEGKTATIYAMENNPSNKKDIIGMLGK